MATGSGTLGDSGAATTTKANDLLIGSNWVSTGTSGPGTGYTQRQISGWDGDILEDEIVSNTGAYHATAPLSSSGNWIMQLAAFKGTSSGPPAPTGLAATAASATQVNLSWTASPGATGYRVERCLTSSCTYSQIAAPTATSYSDAGVAPSTSYSYRVRASDSASNLSTYSTATSVQTPSGTPATTVNYNYDGPGRLKNAAFNDGTSVTYTLDPAGNRTNVTTAADTTPPSVPAGLAGTVVSAYQINLSWTASTDNLGGSGLAGYKIYRGGTQIATSPTNSFSDTTVTGSQTYSYAVAAYDGSGNTSAQSTAISLSTPDVTPPSVPSGLAASAPSSNLVNLSWSASTDNPGGSGVAGYIIYRRGAQIGTSTSTSYADSTVLGTTSYSYTVAAKDAAGNISAQSTAVSVTTPDTIAPSVPTGLTASTATANQVNLSWSASTDTGGSGLAGYKIYRGGAQIATSGATSTAYVDTAVIGSTTYSYTVAAYDNASNVSAQSTATSTTTPAWPPAPPQISASTLQATVNSYFTISWTSSPSATSYQLYETNLNVTPTTTTLVYTGSALSQQRTKGQGDWQYWANACNANGCSANSNSVTVTVCPTTGCP